MLLKSVFSKFATKVFASVFFTSLLIVVVSSLSLSLFFEREFHRTFVDRYEALTGSLGHTLVQVERNTDLLMKNSAQIVRLRDKENKNLSTLEIQLGVLWDALSLQDLNSVILKWLIEKPC